MRQIRAKCEDCSQAFTIIESMMIERRCPTCQAEFRIDRAEKMDKDPAFAKMVRQAEVPMDYNGLWRI